MRELRVKNWTSYFFPKKGEKIAKLLSFSNLSQESTLILSKFTIEFTEINFPRFETS